MANLGRGIGGAAQGAAGGTAIMPGIGTAIGAVGGFLGGLFSGGNDYEEMMYQLQAEAAEAIKNVDIPKLQQLQYQLQPYKEAGLLTPELEATVFAPDSLMAGVSTDPRLKDAQMAALNKMQEVGQGGLTMQDMAMLDNIRRQTAIAEQGKQQQILQDMQQRGMGGSGAELAARLSSSQNAANRAGAEGLQVGAMASQRALEAIMNSGQLGGQMRSQDFNEQSEKAKSQDIINQFNARNRQAVISRNVGAQNASQEFNLRNKQDIMNKNTGLTNQKSANDVAAIQQDYENRMNKAKGVAGANNQQTNYLGQATQRSNDAFSGTMSGLAGAAGAYGSYMNQQKQQEQQQENWQKMFDVYKKQNSNSYPVVSHYGKMVPSVD